jgi:outer membrane immunogenic protein
MAIVASFAGTAQAQSMRVGPWQGYYIGGNIGYQWGSVSNSGTKPSGVAGGIQGGYNWQMGQFVFGAETDLQLSNADDAWAAWKFSNPWFGTLRGRAGFTFSNVLVFGTVGLAYGSVRAQSTVTGVDETRSSLGRAIGAGAEVGLSGNWTAKAEYLYIDLGSRSYSITGTTNGLASSLLRLGVNYHF